MSEDVCSNVSIPSSNALLVYVFKMKSILLSDSRVSFFLILSEISFWVAEKWCTVALSVLYEVHDLIIYDQDTHLPRSRALRASVVHIFIKVHAILQNVFFLCWIIQKHHAGHSILCYDEALHVLSSIFMIVAHVLFLQPCKLLCFSALYDNYVWKNFGFCMQCLIRIPAAHEPRHKRCRFNTRSAETHRLLGNHRYSHLSHHAGLGTAAYTAATVWLPPTLLYKTLWRLLFCFLHSAPCSRPLWLQTVALKCFNHINLGHCQLHLIHPAQCFFISHLNIFSVRMQAGWNCVHLNCCDIYSHVLTRSAFTGNIK